MASLQCKWMWADSGTRRSPFGAAVAKRNPLRWTASMDPQSCIESLRANADNCRPVLLRIHDTTKNEKFDMSHETVNDAIEYFQQMQEQCSSPPQATSSQQASATDFASAGANPGTGVAAADSAAQSFDGAAHQEAEKESAEMSEADRRCMAEEMEAKRELLESEWRRVAEERETLAEERRQVAEESLRQENRHAAEAEDLRLQLETAQRSQEALSQEVTQLRALLQATEKALSHGMHAGAVVQVLKTFEGDSNSKKIIEKGLLGTVIQIDEGGDAEIRFDKVGKQFVFKSNFDKLLVNGGKHDSFFNQVAYWAKDRICATGYARRLLDLTMPYMKEVRRPKVKSQFPLALCPLLCGLVLAYNFYDSSPNGLRLRDNSDFKICTSMVIIAFAMIYRIGYWAAHTYNDDGVPVHLGYTEEECAALGHPGSPSGAHNFYCGRFIPIPGTDGQCEGAGPQCPACATFQKGPFKVWLLQTKWSSRLPKWIALKRWPVEDVKYYVVGIKESLDIAWWLAPSISLAAFFTLWGASEEDLHCGPESWGPMIPLVAQFYLPSYGSPADLKLRTALVAIYVFLPIKAPSVLLPTMKSGISDMEERREYFTFEFAFLMASTLLLLELGRHLSKKIAERHIKNAVFSEPLLNVRAIMSREHTKGEEDISREYKIAFGLYYAMYQILLYILLDYAVAHGHMNLSWGIAWELWICFFQMVCVTGLAVGIPWYIYSGRKRRVCPHPTPLILMQLTPWLGNELHVMKDHIAQALCFACAHCQTGSLRMVGLMLGYLSIGATFLPLYVMLQDKDAFTTLRRGHWPIPEARYEHHDKLPSVRSNRHKDGNSLTDKVLMAAIGEKRLRQAHATKTEAMITCSTQDKLLRAVVGEIPHAVLHVNFAYFFGGGLFILSAIVLSAVRVLLIPIFRELLKSEIPAHGCSENALKMFFTFGKKLNWKEPDDAILAASTYGWEDALGFVRVLAPKVEDIFGQDAQAFQLKLEDLGATWSSDDILEQIYEYADEHDIDLDGVDEGIDHIHVYPEKGDCLVIGDPAVLSAIDDSCFPLVIEFPQSSRIQQLFIHAAEEGAKNTPENPAAGQAEYYIGLLRVLRDQLGVYIQEQAKFTVDQVLKGELSVNCLQHLQEIDKMAGGVSIYSYVDELAHGHQEFLDDVLQAALERAAKSLEPPQPPTDEAKARAMNRAQNGDEEPDGEGTRLFQAKQFEEITYYLSLASIGIPAILMLIMILIRHF